MKNAREGAGRLSLVGSRVGRFEIIAEIGTGGMASVYLARATGSAGRSGFRRLHAIKVMHPHLSQDEQFVDMFLDEARVAATIHHPNVVPIIDVGNDDGLIYLVMDYIEGDSLSNVEKVAINLRRRIPLGITLRVILDSLSGLHYAHELATPDGTHLKIVHRDVSPQNIVISVDGASRIVDFGIAKAESRVTTTKVGMIKGKLNFMAPEQLRSGPLDRRVDIFGLGVTLWEAVTLRRLFAGESDFETARRILAGEYPPLLEFDPKLPPALDDICRKALRPDPAERFQTCAEFADAIETHLRGHIAAPRDVATFIQGVAHQKLDAERRAVRETVNTDVSEPDYLGATVVETAAARRPAPLDVNTAPEQVLPNTAIPRNLSGEASGTRRSAKVRSPTLAMPAPQRDASKAPAAPQRPVRRPAPAPPPNADDHVVYDDDGATEVISKRPVQSVRPVAPKPPIGAAPARREPAEEVDEPDESSRTVFEPNIAAVRAGIVIRPSNPQPLAPQAPAPAPPARSEVEAPVEPTQAIDLVQTPGRVAPEDMLTIPAHRPAADASGRGPVPPMGMGAGPMGAGPLSAPPQMTHMPGVGPVFALPPAAPPAPRTSPLVYVFVGVSVFCLVATLLIWTFARR